MSFRVINGEIKYILVEEPVKEMFDYSCFIGKKIGDFKVEEEEYVFVPEIKEKREIKGRDMNDLIKKMYHAGLNE